MAATTTYNLNSATLKDVDSGGLIREDVMNKIWDISKIPLPFTDMVGSAGTSKNEYKEWTTDELAAPDVANSVTDGADADGNDTKTGLRVGNHCQTSDKVVKVSYRADASDTIGRAKELSYQLMRRQQELRRDVEAIAILPQGSRADTGSIEDTTGIGTANSSGLAGGLPSWLETNTVNVATSGFDATDNTTTKPTYTSAGIALTESGIRDVVESIYDNGGDPTRLMTVPSLVRKFSEYLFTSSARVGTIMSDQGKSREKAAALGSVNVFVTDFGTLTMVPNRLQQKYDDDATNFGAAQTNADVFILDPEYLGLSYLYGYRTDMLAKTGLAEKRQMAVDWTLVVNTEKAHGIISCVDVATDVTA